MAAADRGTGPLTSLSAHVTVGATEWTGNNVHDFAFEDVEAADEQKQSASSQLNETPPDHRSTGGRRVISLHPLCSYQRSHDLLCLPCKTMSTALCLMHLEPLALNACEA